MANRVRHIGAIETSDALASLTTDDGAYMDYDTVNGNARFGAMGSGSVSRGVLIRTLLAGAAVAALTFAAAGAATFASSITATAVTATGLIKSTVAGESLRLLYDASHFVSFAVSSAGGLTITPQSGQSVSVTGFAATGKASMSAQTRIGDLFRVESIASPDTTGLAGGGVEIHYDPSNFGVIKSYDYTAAALKNLVVTALALVVQNAVSISSGGLTSTNTSQALKSAVTTTTNGTINQRWTDNTNYTVDLLYVSGSIVGLYALAGNSFSLGANGAELIRLLNSGYIFVPNSSVPGGNPTAGGYLYVDTGALKWRGPSGTITTMGAA